MRVYCGRALFRGHVTGVGARMRESLATVIASKRLLTCVYASVLLKKKSGIFLYFFFFSGDLVQVFFFLCKITAKLNEFCFFAYS